MTWNKFWKICERYFDRLLTVMVTLIILKSGEYIQIGWTPIAALWTISFLGGIFCVLLAALCEPEREAETVTVG